MGMNSRWPTKNFFFSSNSQNFFAKISESRLGASTRDFKVGLKDSIWFFEMEELGDFLLIHLVLSLCGFYYNSFYLHNFTVPLNSYHLFKVGGRVIMPAHFFVIQFFWYEEEWASQSNLVILIWQYGSWSFQTGGTKLERFLPKNQHTQRKLD